MRIHWMIGPALLVAALLLLPGPAVAAGACDGLKLCYKDSLGTGKGKALAWYVSAQKPIPYTINPSLLPATKRQAAIDAVKAAFSAFELPCTTLKFKYDGLSTSFSDVPGKILIYWGDTGQDTSSWIHGSSVYFRYMHFSSIQTGEIDGGYVALNAKESGWTAGSTEVVKPPAGKTYATIDIKTMMLWLIPDLLGFYVAKDTTKMEVPVTYGGKLTGPCPLHKQGAQFSYFQAGTGCTKPTKPEFCKHGTSPVPGDLGPIPDGFFTDMALRPDKGTVTPQNDAGTTKVCTSNTECPSGQVCTIEGKCVTVSTGEDDSGCNVASSRPPTLPAWLLLALAALVARRRR